MVELEKTDDKRFDSFKGKNIDFLKYAMAVTVCGRHNIIVVGSPGCGKTTMLTMFPMLMTELTADEMKEVNKIYEASGIPRLDDLRTTRPFRVPHQTASLEGMVGGGEKARPGEISLAHKGMLFLDEAAEFRTSILQMLRVPLEAKSITLSRAGERYVYPADFQLVMATSPCPCGNYGSDRVCLCSTRSIKQYWKKFSGPLLDRMEIRVMFNDTYTSFKPTFTLKELRELIKKGQEFQYKRQGKLNADLTPDEVSTYCSVERSGITMLESYCEIKGISTRVKRGIIKVARTIADMHESNEITESHVSTALQLCGETFDYYN